jgi:outer membrane protein assembly factor BamE (lipoprotein component of BamABCDE complex)
VNKVIFAILLATPFIAACAPKTPQQEERATIAAAQRDIKIGMSSAEVVSILGSPNMVTTDSQRRETWVYDRVSTNVSQSASGWSLILAGGQRAQASQNQRTMTIIVHFDENNMVRDMAWRQTSF